MKQIQMTLETENMYFETGTTFRRVKMVLRRKSTLTRITVLTSYNIYFCLTQQKQHRIMKWLPYKNLLRAEVLTFSWTPGTLPTGGENRSVISSSE